MIIKYSEWLKHRMLKEVRFHGQSGVVTQQELERRRSEDKSKQDFLGLNQKKNDLVYFGLHLLKDRLRKNPDQEVTFSLEEIIPYCGAIMASNPLKEKLVVTPPQSEKHRMKSLKASLSKDGEVAGQALEIPVSSLENITYCVKPMPAEDMQLWLYKGNGKNFHSDIIRKLKIATGASATPATRDDLAQAHQHLQSLGGVGAQTQDPDEAPPPEQQGPMSPQDLFPDMERQQQPKKLTAADLWSDEPEAPTQNYSPVNFGPSKSFGNPLGARLNAVRSGQTLSKLTGPSEPGANVKPPLGLRQRLKQKEVDPEQAAMRQRFDLAWTNNSLKYGNYWKTITEHKVFRFYPDN